MQLAIARLATPRSLVSRTWHNLARSMTCQPKKGPSYKLKLALPRDYSRVVEFMGATYMENEPILVNVGLAGDCAAQPALLSAMHNHVSAGMTFFAEDHRGCLVAAVVNKNTRQAELMPPGYYTQTLGCELPPKVAKLFDFYEYLARVPDLWATYCVDDIFECTHLAVHPDHQGKGLARRLVAESWILGRDLAFRLFRIDCSSRYTAMIAEGFGWKCVYSLPYRRYFANGEFFFKCIQEPHTEIRTYVDELDYCDGYYPPMRRR
ncbi:uncharacterized protein LOC106640839 [Copidosoma floridanum]|uniref:uncharacterized protein LOC106640839 n=1 Tax=Copidosoma floridanum TaxID=29053 RepID=UPI0006C9C160|nr:uncharacterized protein LOC106640839 [Copidosoma floridanum]